MHGSNSKDTVLLEDPDIRDRLVKLIDATTDPFATEIRYHHYCWMQNIRNKVITDVGRLHLQGVQVIEAQQMFYDYVREVIFQEHELRTVQGLLTEYKKITANFGFNTSGAKSSYIKELLIKEFGAGIGFHTRQQKNMSEMVYDTSAGGTYIEGTIFPWGVSDEQLVMNVAGHLQDHIKCTKTISWPPYITELEEKEDLSELLLKLIVWMKHPEKKSIEYTPNVCAFASMLTSYVIGKQTTFKANLAVTFHGLALSKELVNAMHKYGIGISYNEVLLLHDFWAVHDLQLCQICPYEIAVGRPAIAIVDNDDFKNDTLTGAGQAHRTNVMYVQPTTLEVKQSNMGNRITNPNELSHTLKDIGSEMQFVTPYKTLKHCEPPLREKAQADIPQTTLAQRKRGVIHALARTQSNGSRTTVEQPQVPSFAGFHASISKPVEKSKAYYHMTYPDPPNKTVLNDVMCKLAIAIEEKNMPFALLVGDQPVYVHLVDLKSENATNFGKILPFMGPFHIQLSFISAIYKRFKGSGLSDVLVAAGVIAAGSVDQALRGKHYKRAIHCYASCMRHKFIGY